MLLLETDSGNLGWSTYHGYNELMQERARVPTLKVKSLESRCKCLVIYELFKSSKIIAQMILLETLRFMFYNLEFWKWSQPGWKAWQAGFWINHAANSGWKCIRDQAIYSLWCQIARKYQQFWKYLINTIDFLFSQNSPYSDWYAYLFSNIPRSIWKDWHS